jgi:dienelactone hydrolase
MNTRTISYVLALSLGTTACGSDSSNSGAGGTTSATGGSGGSGGTGGDATGGMGGQGAGGTGVGGQGGIGGSELTALEQARCGLSYEWLPASSVGALVTDDTPHSSLNLLEAITAKALLETQGIEFDRDPAFETLAHRIVYTTQDRGEPREASALVVVPQVSQAQTFPVLLFHHGTTGLNDGCAPTFGFEDDSTEAYAVALLLSLFSSLGYIVVAPDYLGQNSIGAPSPELHPYLVGEPTAIASWDSARAAQALLATDGSSADFGPVALWGASQGGHAAMYSALYHSHYAPEMDLRTGVYAIPPSDLEAHMTLGTRDLRPSTGNVVLFFTAADSWFQPDLSPGLDQIFLAPFDVQAPMDLAADCSPDTFDNVTAVEEVFTPALIAASQSAVLTNYEPWGCFLRENSVTQTSLPIPALPGLFIIAEDDTLVWSGIERAAFDTLCSQGHNLSYLECAGAGHEEGFFWSIDNALDYIDARLAGVPVTDGCVPKPAETCSNTP